MPSWRRRLQSAAASVFSLPPETVSEVPRVTCVDGREIVVENVTGLLHVSPTEVRLDLGSMRLHVFGRDFEVNLVAGREVHLTGTVDTMRFTRGGGGSGELKVESRRLR